MSALGRACPVGGFPIDRADHEDWRRLIDNWLAEIGRSVFEAAPFRLGVVGFEVDAKRHGRGGRGEGGSRKAERRNSSSFRKTAQLVSKDGGLGDS